MRIRTTVIAALSAALVLALSACGGSATSDETTSSAPTMPGVIGERLDLAYSDLAYVGVPKDGVEVVGGGTFGVIDESNWQVCEQRPEAGAAIKDVRLVVDRTCPAIGSGGGAAGASAAASAASGGEGSTNAMPNLVGMVLQDAQDRLQSMGSYLMDQQDASGQGRLQLLDSNWKVCTQSPPPGTALSLATVVTLAAVKLDEACP